MPNDIAKLRRIMRHANKSVNLPPAFGFRRYAMIWARKYDDVVEDLRNGFVRFEYGKADGTWREALGTLSPHLIPADKMPKTNLTEEEMARQERRKLKGLINYYDLDKDEWRSFYIHVINQDKEHYKAIKYHS